MTHAGIIWLFLSDSLLGNILLVVIAVGSVLLFTLIFQAACSLANVEPPGFLYSLLLVLVTLALTVPVNGVLAYLLAHSPLYELLGTAVVVAFQCFAGFIVCVLLSSILYVLALRISLTKGLLTGLYEQLLALLAFSLLYGTLFVILSLVQLRYGPLHPPKAPPPVAVRTVVGDVLS